MPRPSGKAFKIAEATIPGLNQNLRSPKSSPKKVPNDAVEMKIVSINEHLGKKFNETQSSK